MESSPSSEAAAPAVLDTGSERSPGALVALGQFFFKYRDVISPAVFFALVLGFRPRLPGGDERLNWATNVLGILLVLAGQALRVAVIGFAYIKRGGKDKQVYAERLVQEGFFAHCRNPLYVGNCLTLLGLFVIHNSPWVYAIGIPFYAVLYLSIVAAEEDYLGRKFGSEYELYCRRVNRFVPSFGGLRATVAGMQFDWGRVIRKEYGTTFSWVTCVLGLVAWEEYLHFGYEARKTLLYTCSGLWWASAAGWLLARVAKKKGWLGEG